MTLATTNTVQAPSQMAPDTLPKPDCIYCGHNDHWSQDCQSLDGIAPAQEAES